MKKLTWLLIFLLAFSAFASPFDSLVFDQDQKSNLKKLNELAKKRATTLLWWNVAWGHYNGDGSLDKNLLGLVNSPLAPDIIAMSEYKSVVISASTRAALEMMYPHTAFVTGLPTDETGVIIMSRYPFKASQTYQLDWTPEASLTKDQDNYRSEWNKFDPGWVKYWDRAFAHYEISLPDGRTINVAPVHLCSPWSSVFKKLGSWKAFRTIMAAHENPLLYQQQRLTEDLQRDFGEDMDRAPLILIGDFNIPSKISIPIIGGTPKMYKLLRGPLEDVLDSGDDTFPSKSTEWDQTGPLKNHSVQLDHAFFNGKIKNARGEVLNLKGSDHYPVMMLVD